MSVEVTFIGRLGNNFFQYALGRIIAQHLGMELRCVCPEDKPVHFMGSGVELGPPATLSALSAHFPHAPMSIEGINILEPSQQFDVRANPNWDGQRIDLTSVLSDRTPRNIQLAGYFQRYEYFHPFRQELRHWFLPQCAEEGPPVTSKDVLVSIRRGVDYEIRKWILPMDYYHRALGEIKASGRLFVCGTCIDEHVRAEFERYQPTYYEGTPLQHLCFMMKFRKMILSNSTFAWWGAFLSDADEIYAPRSQTGKTFAPSGFGNVDLNPGDHKFHEIPIDGIATVGFPISPKVAAVQTNCDGDGVSVRYSDGTMTQIPIDERNKDWLFHSIEDRLPLSPDFIREKFIGADLSSFIEKLVHFQVLLQETVRLEP